MNSWKSNNTSSFGSSSHGGNGGAPATGNGGKRQDYSHLPNGNFGNEEEDWMQRQVRGHKTQIAQQDQELDEIGRSVERLGHISLGISKELDDQNRMLGEIDGDFETAIDQMDVVTRKTKELIRKSGGCRNFAIVVFLSVVLFVLIILVMYT
ncbi:unnamed protein product [Phaeothamnion confervicola]